MHDKVLHTLSAVGHLQLECFQMVVDVYFTSRNGTEKNFFSYSYLTEECCYGANRSSFHFILNSNSLLVHSQQWLFKLCVQGTCILKYNKYFMGARNSQDISGLAFPHWLDTRDLRWPGLISALWSITVMFCITSAGCLLPPHWLCPSYLGTVKGSAYLNRSFWRLKIW